MKKSKAKKKKSWLKQQWSDARKRSLLLITLVYLFLFVFMTPLGSFNDWVPPSFHKGYYSIIDIDPSDDTNWYSFLRSTYHDGEIDFSNDKWYETTPQGLKHRKGYFHANHLTETGYAFGFSYGVGSSLLWAPFLMVGDLLSDFYEWIELKVKSHPEVIDGFRYPEMVWVGFGTMAYMFLGFLICFHLFSKRHSVLAAFLSVLALLLCTELSYFSFVRNRMPHGIEFFALCLAMLFWERIYEGKDELIDHLLMALSFGFLVLVRVNASLYLSIPMMLYAWRFWQHWRAKNQPMVKKNLFNFLLLCSCTVFMLLPLMIVNKAVHGTFFDFFVSTKYYEMIKGDIFAASSGSINPPLSPLVILYGIFFRFNPIESFFSPYFGMLWFSPIIILGFVGLGTIFKSDRTRAIIYFVGFMPSFMLFSKWVGHSYGHRYMLPVLFFMGYGLTVFFHWFISWMKEKQCYKLGLSLVLSVIGLCFVWNHLMLIQFKIVIPFDDPNFLLHCV